MDNLPMFYMAPIVFNGGFRCRCRSRGDGELMTSKETSDYGIPPDTMVYPMSPASKAPHGARITSARNTHIHCKSLFMNSP